MPSKFSKAHVCSNNCDYDNELMMADSFLSSDGSDH